LTTHVITKQYRQNFAFIRIKGIIPNPVNARQYSFDLKCLIDTGFYGGIYVPKVFFANAQLIGVTPRPTTVTLADGSEITAYVCLAYLQQIENYSFQSPGKPIFLVIYGHKTGKLIGMDAMQHFSVLFDGSANSFTINV